MATPANRSRWHSMAVFDAVVSAVMVYQYKSFETTCKIRKIIGKWRMLIKNRQKEELDMIKNRTFDNEKGMVEEILDGVYVLTDRAQYDEVTGN